MARALILGGTGAIGRATALRLLEQGWRVDLTGRDPRRFDPAVTSAGGRYVRSDRFDSAQLAAIVGVGADLLVDCACYSAQHASALVPFARDADSTVMVSSKAVYVDEWGHHANTAEPPRFDGPIGESHATMAPSNVDYSSREGYGANKVAAENVLLDCGAPVSVLRPSKIHGVGSRRAREWYFVRRVLERRPVVVFADRGRGVDHPSAAANLAALIEVVAARPGRRVLNAADPDAPSVLEIARVIADALGHQWREVLVDDAPGEIGHTPWSAAHPIVLDTSASLALGYRPEGTYASTVRASVAWLAEGALVERSDLDDDFFEGLFDYAAEDDFLAAND